MKKKILIPIIVAGVIVIGGGTFAYAYNSSNTVRSDVYTLTGIGNRFSFDTITPNSKYNSFREYAWRDIYFTTKKALPLGINSCAGEGMMQFLTDKQIQELTGTDNEKDMRISVSIVKAGTKVGPNERLLTNEFTKYPTVYVLVRFWNINNHAHDLGNLDFKVPTKLKEEGAISNPSEIVWGEFGNKALPNFKAKIYVASYKAISALGEKMDKSSNEKLITTIANFTSKELEAKTGTTVEKDMTVRPVKNGEEIHRDNSYQFVYPNKKSTLIIFGHSK